MSKSSSPNSSHEETQGSAWERVREVMLRDHGRMRRELQRPEQEMQEELHEAAKHALADELPGPAKAPTIEEVYGDDDSDVPFSYGSRARQRYQERHPTWDNDLENHLRVEWERAELHRPWNEVREHVRRGYEKRVHI